MGIGDDELAAEQAALDQAAQERAPERLRLRLADVEADHLPAAGLVHAVGDDQALPDDAAAVPDLLDLRIEEQVGVAALERPLSERLDLLVEAGADARDLALGDAQPERLDDLVDLARRDTGDVGLLDHRHQRLLGTLARLQEAREVAALADLRDLQLDLARPGVPAPRPIPVAMRRTILRATVAELCPDQLGHPRVPSSPRRSP